LILDALNKDPSRHSKLEKADILEMTVRHLQNVQRQQMASAISTDPTVLNKYRAGFNECATEVGRYIGRVDGVDHGLRQRILSHLNTCVSSLNVAANMATNSYANPQRSGTAFPGMIPPSNSPFTANTPLHVQIPLQAATAAAIAAGMFPNSGLNTSGDINNNTSSPLMTSSISLDGKPNIATPPSSASSTASSHFTFTIPMHQCSPPLRNHHLFPYHHDLNVNVNQNNISNVSQMPLNSSSGMIFRQGSTGSWSRNSCLESPIGQSSISPSGSSIGSGQLSPSESDHDVEMVLEPPRRAHHNSVCNALPNSDSVWRPW